MFQNKINNKMVSYGRFLAIISIWILGCNSNKVEIKDTNHDENDHENIDIIEQNEGVDLLNDILEDIIIDDAIVEQDNDILDEITDTLDGCYQEIPSITEQTPEWCSAEYPDSCLQHTCGDCQVCYIDISAWPPSETMDGPAYNCEGDGACHTLCANNNDCSTDEECINLAWANGTDVKPSACLQVCWIKGDISIEKCP